MNARARVSAHARTKGDAHVAARGRDDRSAPAPATWAEHVLGLQRAVGNRATQGILGASSGAAIQAKAAGPGAAAGPRAAAGGLNPTGIPAPVRGKMESALGADFSGVRVHPRSPRAAALGALAYTQGSEIHMAPGQWAPETRQGQEILGHELAHVVQQREGRVQATAQYKGVALNDDAGLEAEADALGTRAARGDTGLLPRMTKAPATPASSSGVAVQRAKAGAKRGASDDDAGSSAADGDAPAKKPRVNPFVFSKEVTDELKKKTDWESYGANQSQVLFKVKGKGSKNGVALTGKNAITKIFDGSESVAEPKSFENLRTKQALRWISTMVFRHLNDKSADPREVQAALVGKQLYMASNTRKGNKALMALASSGTAAHVLREIHKDLAKKTDLGEREARHLKKLNDNILPSSSDQATNAAATTATSINKDYKDIIDALSNGIKIAEGNPKAKGKEAGELHAERRIAAVVGISNVSEKNVGGVKRPCANCYLELYAADPNVHPGPYWPSGAANIGFTEYESKDAAGIAKKIDELPATYVTFTTDKKGKKTGVTHEYDTDSDSDSDT